MRLFGPKELQSDIIEKGLCSGCGGCVDICPYFRSHRGKTAIMFPCTLEKGSCYAFCPKTEVDLDELSMRFFGRPFDGSPLGHHLSIQISRAGGRVSSPNFQAGGTVSALMAFAMMKGLVEAAVLTDREELLPLPRLVKDPSEVLRCASSKYSAAPTLSAFHRGVKEGIKRLGLVVTPCQALALAQFRLNPLQQEDFRDPAALVVGLFCTWSLDFRALKDYLSGKMDPSKIRKVDIPPPPAEIMEIYDDQGKWEIPLAEVRQLVLHSCSFCMDMTAEFSDLSVGVMEGRPDLNTLIIRTERGMEIVSQARKEGFLITEDIPEENLKHLTWAAANKKKRALAKIKAEGLFNTDEGGRAALRFSDEVAGSILAGEDEK
jgi:coenzyme F420 hydrogenase subunit beta